jgi:predicted Zn finger-like uncharacterized protein
MIAKCPTCEAKYRVADEKVSPGGTKFKCKKCKTAFTVYRELPERSAGAPERRAPAVKTCPHCGKAIPAQAIKCRWCRQDVSQAQPAESGGFEGQEEYGGPGEEHHDPFAPQAGAAEEHADAFAPQEGSEGHDTFAPEGGGQPGGNLFESEDFSGGAPSPGGYPGAGAPGASAAFGVPITGKKINPLLFAIPMWLGIIAAVTGAIIGETAGRALGGMISFAGFIGVIYATVYGFIALYRTWYIIPDAYARTTPGRAVGFLFIPLFNFYWIFVAAKGLADDARDFMKKAGVMEQTISPGLSLAYAILSILSFVPGVSVAFMIVETILIFQWAKFTGYVLDNPGPFAKIHSGAPRTTNNGALFIFAAVIGLAVLGILAAIIIPAIVAMRAQ